MSTSTAAAAAVISCEDAVATSVTANPLLAEPVGEKATKKPRVKRGRIDIDDQIEEANRIAAMLKKAQNSAKSLKKTSQKTKKRLMAKADRLDSDDLIRIAALKKFGLFTEQKQDEMDLPDHPEAVSCHSKKKRVDIGSSLRTLIEKELGGIMTTKGCSTQSSGSVSSASAASSDVHSGTSTPVQTSGLLRLGSNSKLPSFQAPKQIDEPSLDDAASKEVGEDVSQDEVEVADAA